MKKEVRAEILAIGDELLYGQVQDTNSHWISQELTKIGIRVVRRTTVGDEVDSILDAFKSAENRADIILITGGLGPTQDDLTKPVLAKHFGCELKLVPEALEALNTFFQRRGKTVTETNRLQAFLPTKSIYVPNEVGTAPGMWFEEHGCVWMSMPGVPHEMKKLMADFVLPKLRQLFPLPVIHHQFIRTVGIGESWLSDLLKDWEHNLPKNIRLAYLPSLGEVRLRLTAFADNLDEAREAVEEQVRLASPLIDKYTYAHGEVSLQDAVGRLLRDKGQKVAFAESCTGGYLAHLTTSIPGSSEYFNGGIIPYQNEIKENLLGVSGDTLARHGAVSEETVTEMAAQVRERFNADYGVASSGVAGPSGGTPEKPVGTVWIACSHSKGTKTRLLRLTEDRAVNIHLTAISALNLLRQCVMEEFD